MSHLIGAHEFLAFDLGAESGRAVLGVLRDGILGVREIHRFPTGQLNMRGRSRWNVFRMLEELRRGLAAASSAGRPESVGIDTWGVDFSFLTPEGDIAQLPYTYRDSRTDGAMESFFARVPRERVYALTGIQMLQFNTLFQLESMVRDGLLPSARLEKLLFIPDIFHYLLGGIKRTEFTFATTSQLFNPMTFRWEPELFEALGVPVSMMQETVMPGTVLGGIDDPYSVSAGLGGVPIVAVASHDTGSAVAAIPAEGNDWAYISSGTWSLMGIESEVPVMSPAACAMNFTNEGGVDGRWRVLKNIAGLWILQECRRAWDPDRRLDYAELAASAAGAEPFRSLIDPDSPCFRSPEEMPAAIERFCTETGQPPPRSRAAFARCAMESLALKYRLVLEQLKRIHPGPINRLHIVGGGSQNQTLCQFTADATGLPVLAGPAEATAAGNLLVQARALGMISGLDGIRCASARSFAPKRYEPGRTGGWEPAWQRFREICG
jgi:rhamnulokinase